MGNSLTSGNKLYYQCSVSCPPHTVHRGAAPPWLLGSASPGAPLWGAPGSGGWAGAATAWGHFGSCCARVVSRGCCPRCPCHQAGTSPSITALHSRHPPHVLFCTSSVSSMDPSFRRKCRAWWGLGGASWALLLLALALTLIRGARLPSEQQQLQVPALLTPPLGPPHR